MVSHQGAQLLPLECCDTGSPRPAACMIGAKPRRSVVPFTARQIGPCFAAEVDGLDLRKPLSPEDVTAIHAAMDTHAVLVFHDQYLTDEQHLAFSRSLGELEE